MRLKLNNQWINLAKDATIESIQTLIGSQELSVEEVDNCGGLELHALSIEKILTINNLFQEYGQILFYYLKRTCDRYLLDTDKLLEEFKSSYVGYSSSANQFAQCLWERSGKMAKLEALGIETDDLDWSSIATKLEKQYRFEYADFDDNCYIFKRNMIYTFGYGNRPNYDYLKQQINQYGITSIADIRLMPDKAWSGRWKSKALSAFCKEIGINYSQYPCLGNQGMVKNQFNPPDRKEADGAIELLAKKTNLLLLCSELKPDGCHRSIVAKEIQAINKQKIIHL